MSEQLQFPDCVNRSLVEPSPLDGIDARGFTLEWIDCASPYRTYFAVVQENSKRSYVIRDELRFRRIKDAVVPVALWKGRLSISNEVFDAACKRLISSGASEARSVAFDPDGLDGELFVLRMKFGISDHIARFAWPEARQVGRFDLLKREFDYFLNLPKSSLTDGAEAVD